MISDLTAESSKPPMILPPLDIEWVWFCHTLNPVCLTFLHCQSLTWLDNEACNLLVLCCYCNISFVGFVFDKMVVINL